MRIRGLEGLGGLGLGCEWLAGLVWEGLGCVGFSIKILIVEITAAGSNNGGGRVVGLLCMGRNRAGSNLAVHFDFFSFFFPIEFFKVLIDRICVRSHLRRNKGRHINMPRHNTTLQWL